MKLPRIAALFAVSTSLLVPLSARAQSPDVGAATCATLTARVDAVAGTGPVFLRSYDHADGEGPNAEPALNGAFTYDNALAAIALVACGRVRQARRIGDALVLAATEDRAGPVMGRLRNAYRSGAQIEHPLPPMGWWSNADQRWREDAYQVGTATGNVAWTGLALVTLAETTQDDRYRASARKLADWIVANTRDTKGDGGFTGGVFGDVHASKKETWKSTEHAADAAALFARLGMTAPARHARAFLEAMWRAGEGHFPTGAGTDGVTVNRATSGLDAQLWPLLLAFAPKEWQQALLYAERAHGIRTKDTLVGFDFNDDRDGVWIEGTAQAALVYRLIGRDAEATRLLDGIAREISPGGYVWATREAKVTTGLAIGPDSITDDFLYYRLPHLGATAWTAIAARGWNPFTGKKIP